jgi:hypothetical protein
LLTADFLFSLIFFRPDDDGSFRRTNRRDERDYFQPSHGDSDDNWRRGGGGGGFRDDRGERGFDDRRGGYDRRSGGFDDRGHDRRGGGGGGGFEDRGQERRGGGGGGFEGRSNMDRRPGFDDRERGTWRGAGGYDNNNDRDSGQFDRRGGYDNNRGLERSSKPGPQGSSADGSRPRLQLKARTEPVPQDPVKEKLVNVDSGNVEAPPKDEVPETPPKNNETQVEITESSKGKAVDEEKKRGEPKVVNSRAAAMGFASSVSREVSDVKSLLITMDFGVC